MKTKLISASMEKIEPCYKCGNTKIFENGVGGWCNKCLSKEFCNSVKWDQYLKPYWQRWNEQQIFLKNGGDLNELHQKWKKEKNENENN